MKTAVRLIIFLAGFGWSIYYLADAFEKSHRALTSPFFIYWQDMPQHIAATDWKTPLLIAALPLAAYGAVTLVKNTYCWKKSRAASRRQT